MINCDLPLNMNLFTEMVKLIEVEYSRLPVDMDMAKPFLSLLTLSDATCTGSTVDMSWVSYHSKRVHCILD